MITFGERWGLRCVLLIFATGTKHRTMQEVEEPNQSRLAGDSQLSVSKVVLESQTSLLWKKLVATDQYFPVLSQTISALISRIILGSLMCSQYLRTRLPRVVVISVEFYVLEWNAVSLIFARSAFYVLCCWNPLRSMCVRLSVRNRVTNCHGAARG